MANCYITSRSPFAGSFFQQKVTSHPCRHVFVFLGRFHPQLIRLHLWLIWKPCVRKY